MSATDMGFANRCLPLLIANQSGWLILNKAPFTAMWTGGDGTQSVLISDARENRVATHFGHGILTWSIPFLFRTPPGFNLLVRGPANHPKDAVSPLEGMVETDWAPATFTMSWKITRPFTPVAFEEDEPICMIVPQRRGELEEFAPEIRPLASDGELAGRYQNWWRSRQKILRKRSRASRERRAKLWQMDYFAGQHVTGEMGVDDHQVRLHVRGFESS
jgi:hypothetical protein